MEDKKKLPDNFETLKEFWAFWDDTSSADFEDAMEDVEPEINISSSKVYFAVAKEILRPIREKAQEQGVSTEALISLWLQEKVST